VQEEEAHACAAMLFKELDGGVGAVADIVYAQIYQV
jgi:hypothetical protein